MRMQASRSMAFARCAGLWAWLDVSPDDVASHHASVASGCQKGSTSVSAAAAHSGMGTLTVAGAFCELAAAGSAMLVGPGISACMAMTHAEHMWGAWLYESRHPRVKVLSRMLPVPWRRTMRAVSLATQGLT